MMRWPIFVVVLLAVFLSGCDFTSRATDTSQSNGENSLLQNMGGQPAAGFARAFEPRPFVFPADHGPHPEFATEWWYFTGNLFASDGRRFGYQLTLFRVGLDDVARPTDSPWRTTQMYMGHLALSDVSAGRHYQDERFSRAAAGLAGAMAEPLRVWLGPWSIAGEPQSTWPIRLDASTDAFSVQLTLDAGEKPIVLQGDRGLSQKGAAAGNASFYYSFTRLPTSGTVSINNETFTVEGNSWFDREWSSSALADDQAGWDWFALQLTDGRDLMFYRMRGKDGAAQRFSKGVLVNADGTSRPLSLDEVVLAPVRVWNAPSGAAYPVEWTLAIPQLDIDLSIDATFDEQAMETTVAYWEGAVDIKGTHTGVGYMELSGYSDSLN